MPCAVCRQHGHKITTCLHRKEDRLHELASQLKKFEAEIERRSKTEYDEGKIRGKAIIANRKQAKRCDTACKDDGSRDGGKDSDESSDWTCPSTSESE